MVQVAGRGVGRYLHSTDISLQRRATTFVHIYPSVLHALAGRPVAGRLDGRIRGYRGADMQDPASELPRITIPRTWVNKGYGSSPKQALTSGMRSCSQSPLRP